MSSNVSIETKAAALYAGDPTSGQSITVIASQIKNWAFVSTGPPGLYNIRNITTQVYAVGSGNQVIAEASPFAWLVSPPPESGATVIITNPDSGLVWDVPTGVQPGSPIELAPAAPGTPGQEWAIST